MEIPQQRGVMMKRMSELRQKQKSFIAMTTSNDGGKKEEKSEAATQKILVQQNLKPQFSY